jgi:hypothetical protein
MTTLYKRYYSVDGTIPFSEEFCDFLARNKSIFHVVIENIKSTVFIPLQMLKEKRYKVICVVLNVKHCIAKVTVCGFIANSQRSSIVFGKTTMDISQAPGFATKTLTSYASI